jgi:hypothetical protein
MSKKLQKIYPDQTVEKAAIAAGAQVLPLWQMAGPARTSVVWMEGLLINGHLVIVQTFESGFLALTTVTNSREANGQVDAILTRCGVKAPATAG